MSDDEKLRELAAKNGQLNYEMNSLRKRLARMEARIDKLENAKLIYAFELSGKHSDLHVVDEIHGSIRKVMARLADFEKAQHAPSPPS